MPVRFPRYELPDFSFEQNSAYGRNLQEAESLPRLSYSVGTSLALTSVITQVPGLLVEMAVPGNSYLEVTSFLDLSCDTAARHAIGFLYTRSPQQASATVSTYTTNQIVLVPGFLEIRATLGQTWLIPDPAPGVWQIGIRAQKHTNGTSAATGNAKVFSHNSMIVRVL